jgi:ATP-dependent DNA helicase RecG
VPKILDALALKHHDVSRPRNPLIADVSFKASYIDTWGRGTLKIINSCKEAGLPEPDMVEFNGGLLVTAFKDEYSTEQLKKLGLNERQIIAIRYVKEKGKITNKDYRTLNNISDRTALRDLEELFKQGILLKEGDKKGTVYKLGSGG